MEKRIILILLLTIFTAVLPTAVFAQLSVRGPLEEIYNSREDLQACFDSKTHRAIAGSKAGLLFDLQDWAEQYGWKEYESLRSYGSSDGTLVPVRINKSEIESKIGAKAYVVIDSATGSILTVKHEKLVWPIASLSKLITASIVLDHNVSEQQTIAVRNSDNVGGASLLVNDGDTLSVNDLFYAALIASANNAANALSRSVGLTKDDFVSEMNAYATKLNLADTKFFEPSGIDPKNVSTPIEMARLARDIFKRDEIKHYTTTANRVIQVENQGIAKKMINTNWLLYKPQYDNVFVTSGKTGYLDESGWNLVVSLRPKKTDERELLIVLFGAKSRADSFNDVEKLSNWAWKVYQWNSQAPSI